MLYSKISGLISGAPKAFHHKKALNSRKVIMQILSGEGSFHTMPQWVGFTTTAACNLRCPQCQTHGTEQSRAEYNKQHWPHELTLRIADETLPSAYHYCLTLNGEPLATPRLIELLDKLQPYGAKLHLTTNGTLLSQDLLSRLLPQVSAIHISIDGGTKEVVETIRLGTKFEQLIHRIRVLTRSCELLSGIVSCDIRFAFTVMASNIRDMPEVIRLAHQLGVPAVDFYPLLVFDASVEDESPVHHAPLFNAYNRLAKDEGQRLGIHINQLQSPFPDIEPDTEFKTDRKTVVTLPRDYYANIPHTGFYLDNEKIELEASSIAASVRAKVSSHHQLGHTPFSFDYMKHMAKNMPKLISMILGADIDIPWCEELYTKAFVRSNGSVAPCCIPGNPHFGNVNEDSVGKIWNGTQRANFIKAFQSVEPPKCCFKCRNYVHVSRRLLISRFFPELKKVFLLR